MYYSRKRLFKLFILIGSVIIGSASLIYTKLLTDELKIEEEQKVALWAEATRQLVQPDIDEQAVSLMLEVLKNNNTVPVLLTDDKGIIYHHRNIKLPKQGAEQYLQSELERMKKTGKRIVINLGDDEVQYLYYRSSLLLVKLTWFPIVQLIIIIVFVLTAYFAFNSARKREQDQVWVGMSKETAHQLGTPISSLMGWADLLALKDENSKIVPEMKNDISRLQNVADRFSKIGSKPILKSLDLKELVSGTLDYFQNRVSSKIQFKLDFEESKTIYANAVLLEWVLENLIKNAIDATLGKGVITISSQHLGDQIVIDISDDGKGIHKSKHTTVFEPGYTSKERGWGLGLTLTKRIVEEYHGGKIFVKESELGKGTTFRIIL
ncbi:sensor histidine kinase [Saccharicrinis aurantiacus]|uniref:sensor histidine kinase n=1 Tax=Saccharicrinis aurantiacus TaxID=1849719 RepID=UPI0008388196|nr:HAMP domain-containing sensor histidine kinase [Saccharicrinis aurantiacus]